MNGLRDLPNVAIVGRPNVGKSALFNRLVGRKIAIVHDQPGITRDRISAICTRGGRAFRLWDTGGILGAGETELTAQVRATAEKALRESDLVLFVVDAKDGLTPVDQDLARALRKAQKPVLLVINKIDHEAAEALSADFDSLGFEQGFSVSAEHNRGIGELLEQIEQLLPAKIENRKTCPERREAESNVSKIQNALSLAIIGRPNVGKSSLINALLGSEHAIVSELPGTTRDAVDIFYERDGEQFLFIDTAGMRRRGKHSSSVEVFSVMRAERSIRRADLCVLIVDLTTGVTAQDKRIAGLIQHARKAAIVVLNKWDLFKPSRGGKQTIRQLVDETRARLFFLDYAPVLVASARTGENIERLFSLIQDVRRESRVHIGTGVLNRIVRAAFAANPPPMKRGKRLKLFYAAQASARQNRSADGRNRRGEQLAPPEFALFVNDPRLITDQYRRYLEARLRAAQSFAGLPIVLTLRARSEKFERLRKRSGRP
jgi:GTPase